MKALFNNITKKQIMSFFLAVLMVVTVFPVHIIAEGIEDFFQDFVEVNKVGRFNKSPVKLYSNPSEYPDDVIEITADKFPDSFTVQFMFTDSDTNEKWYIIDTENWLEQSEYGYVSADDVVFDTFPGTGSAIGSVAEITVASVDLYKNPESESSDVKSAVTIANKEVVIKNYYMNSVTGEIWYLVDAIPGETWPEEYADYRYISKNSVQILASGKVYVTAETEGVEIVDNKFTMYEYDKVEIAAASSLQGSVEYRWQVYVDGVWVDIHGENAKSVKIGYGILAGVADENGNAIVRPVSQSAAKFVAGDPITISVTEDKSMSVTLNNVEALVLPEIEDTAVPADETDSAPYDDVTVRVEFVFTDDSLAADPVIFTVPANSQGQAPGRVTVSQILGYEPVLVRPGHDGDGKVYTESTYEVTLDGLSENETIQFVYYPAKVKYQIQYYLQNADNDEYTLTHTDHAEGFTGGQINIEAIKAMADNWEGYKQLPFAVLENGIAANGSTVVEVYYDRLYYLMLFELDGGYGVLPIYARYGTHIVIDNPSKPGHLFMGWDDVTAGEGDENEDWLPEEMPAHDSKYKAMWKPEEVSKVSVVIWGENPNDENYSYMANESFEFYAKPGSELTFGNGYKCGLDNHTHTEACGPICEKEAHIHDSESCYDLQDLICDEIIHAHSEKDCGLTCIHTAHELECYQVTNNQYYQYELRENTSFDPADYDSSKDLGNGIYTYTDEAFLFGSDTTYYYVKIGEKWYTTYRTNGNSPIDNRAITLNCNHTTHFDACYHCGYRANDHQHSWQEGCYSLNCSKEYHIHNDEECYNDYEHTHTDACSMQIADMDTALWTLVKSDEVTVEADGSTVRNVYYDRTEFTLRFRSSYSNSDNYGTIVKKWGASIGQEFVAKNNEAGSALWSEKRDASGPWTGYLDEMPSKNMIFYAENGGNYTHTAKYYVQNVDGTYPAEPKFTIEIKYSSSNLDITAEDFFGIEGFTYHHGTSGANQNMTAPGDYDDFDGAEFYYTRDTQAFVYNNGFGDIDDATKTVKFGESLESYKDYTPAVPVGEFENNSVKFGGWFKDPDCTQPFVFDGATMPANDIKVYAKWIPVTHTVTFYQDLAAKEAGNIYTGKDQNGTDAVEFKFDVSHGSLISDVKTPPADPTNGQYEFIGWFYVDQHGNEYVWDFENSQVTFSVDIYGKWSSKVLKDYTVRYVYVKNVGTEDNPIYEEIAEIAAPTTGQMLGGNSKTFIAKDSRDFYAEYQTGGYYFPTEQSHTITIDLDDPSQNTKTFYYVKKDAVPYKVEHYHVIDGVAEATPFHTDPYEDNVKAVITAHYKPTAGWVPENGVFQKTLVIDADTPENNVVKFYYVQDTQNGVYRVEYYLESLIKDENGESVYVLDESRTFYGMRPVGEIASVGIPIEITNFTFNKYHQGNVYQAEIVAGEEAVLKQYYDRDSLFYDIYFLEEGTNKILRQPVLDQTAPYMYQPIIPDYYIEGYTYTRSDPENFVVSRDGMVINLYYRRSTAYLTIQKEGHESVDVNQTYIFDVKGVEGTATAGLSITGTVHGNGKVTVADVPVGKYTVTERMNWSWRYQSTTVQYTGSEPQKIMEGEYQIGATVEITGEKDTETITFTNAREKLYWLDGDNYSVNIFDGKNTVDTPNS